MKKIFFLTLIYSSLFQNSFCQSGWASDSASWYYNFSSFWEGSGYESMRYAGDTVIDNHLCKFLQRDLYIQSWSKGDSNHIDLGKRIIYQHGDTIWQYRDSSFIQLYNMDLGVGDTVTFMTFSHDHFIHIVEDTGRVEINGIDLKKQILGIYRNNNKCLEVEVIEKLGISGYPFTFFWNESFPKIVDAREWYLTCYSDNHLGSVNFGNFPCSYWPPITHISENEIPPLLNIFPNPVAQSSWITTNLRIQKIEILDMSGKLYFSHNKPYGELKLDFSQYPNGMYVVKIVTEDNIFMKKMLKSGNQ